MEDFLDCADFFGRELAGGGGGAGAGVGDAGAEGFAADPGDGSEGTHGHGDHGTGGGGLHFLGDVQEVYHVLEGLGHYGKFEDVGAGVFQGFEDFPHLVFFRGFVEVVAGGDDQAVFLVDTFYQTNGIQAFHFGFYIDQVCIAGYGGFYTEGCVGFGCDGFFASFGSASEGEENWKLPGSFPDLPQRFAGFAWFQDFLIAVCSPFQQIRLCADCPFGMFCYLFQVFSNDRNADLRHSLSYRQISCFYRFIFHFLFPLRLIL